LRQVTVQEAAEAANCPITQLKEACDPNNNIDHPHYFFHQLGLMEVSA
jgi:hypothetical protein